MIFFPRAMVSSIALILGVFYFGTIATALAQENVSYFYIKT